MAKKTDMPTTDASTNAPNAVQGGKPASRLFLSAGHGGHDPGACANGLREADLTTSLREAVKAELIAQGVDRSRIVTDADNWDFPATLSFFANNCRVQDTLLELHFNAGPEAARGTETYVRVGASPAELDLGTRLSAAVSAALGTPNRGLKPENNSQHPRLAVLHYAGTSCLLETEFVTNRVAIQHYQALQGPVARAIAQTLLATVFNLSA